MPRKLNPQARILFFGLDERLATELKHVLPDPDGAVVSRPLSSVAQCQQIIGSLGADLAFGPVEGKHYRVLLEAVRQSRLDLPVVVVSRCPHVGEWLDALEDGAADYCAPPFEITQLRWILESCLQPKRAAVARSSQGV